MKMLSDRRPGLSTSRAAALLAVPLAIHLAGCSSPSETADATGTSGPAVVTAGTTDPGDDATMTVEAATPDLLTAATELWNARKQENWPVVFSYQDAETRENFSADEYEAWASENEPFIIRDWTFGEVIAEGPMGWVEVTSTTMLRRYREVPPRETHRWEKWFRAGESWYPVPSTETAAYPSAPTLRDRAEENRLRARFGESWEARTVEDWGTLFEMSDPEDVSNVEMDAFMSAHGKILYLDHEIRWVEVVGDNGIVNVAYVFKLNDPNLSKLAPRSALVNERWVKRDDMWYRDLAGSRN